MFLGMVVFNIGNHMLFSSKKVSQIQIIRGVDILHNSYDRTLADKLAEKVRIFGMIITMPQNKLTKAIHAKETWARRLNG
ncbi:unnamed protein product, partial [Hymenolepis diminuta]